MIFKNIGSPFLIEQLLKLCNHNNTIIQLSIHFVLHIYGYQMRMTLIYLDSACVINFGNFSDTLLLNKLLMSGTCLFFFIFKKVKYILNADIFRAIELFVNSCLLSSFKKDNYAGFCWYLSI